MERAMAAEVIVIGNEKGGAGKSTIAIHLTTALLHGGARVGVMDLDLRQCTLGHFVASRRKWAQANGADLPMPVDGTFGEEGVQLAEASEADQLARFEQAFDTLSAQTDFIVIDTPGGDTAVSRAAHGRADLIVTPMNDSFVDFDMMGVVDPVTMDLVKPSLYAMTVWEARKVKAAATGKMMNWVVLRNRLATAEARNRRRLDDRMAALAKRTGFKLGPGLRDRVIYRELFPFGLTVADLSASVRPVAVSLSHVAARQELRALMQSVGLGAYTNEPTLAA
jgi:chromosome partitioning protein